MFLDIRMVQGSVMDVFQEFWRCKPLAAAFTPLQGMNSDDFIPDRNGSNGFLVFDANGLGRTDIGAGSAADAGAFNRYNVFAAIPFDHFQRIGPDDFPAHPFTQMAPDTAIRLKGDFNAMGSRQLQQRADCGAKASNCCMALLRARRTASVSVST